MKLKSLSILFLGASMILPSCSKHDEDEVTNQNLGSYYNVITDIQTGEKSIENEVTYSVLRNYSKQTADITVKGLKLPNGETYPSFTIEGAKWKYDGAWMASTEQIPSIISNSVRVPVMDNLTFNTWVRFFDSYNGTTNTEISYTVNNRYKVVSYPYISIAWGVTVATDTKTNQDFSTEQTVYVIEVDPDKSTAALTINDFCMSPENNISAIYVKDLPFTMADDGALSIEAASGNALIAGISDADAQKLPFTNLKLTLKRGLINLTYQITTPLGTYSVTCNQE